MYIDGFSAALAVLLGYGAAGVDLKEVTFTPLQYGEKLDSDFTSDRELQWLDQVIFVDICPAKEDLAAFADRCRKYGVEITVYDHHKTATDLYGESGTGYIQVESNVKMMLDNSRSGARIAYDVFMKPTEHNKEAFKFFELVSNRDLWKDDADAKSLSAALSVEKMEFPVWMKLLADFIQDPDELLGRGDAILARDRNLAAEISKGMRVVTVDGHRVPLVFAPKSLASEVGNFLADKYTEYPFAVTVEVGAQVVAVSLRSNGFDTTTVSEKFKGGGHRKASGFRISMAELLEILQT